MKTPTHQLERITCLMVLGVARALQEELITLDEAAHLILSPHTMGLLREAGARQSVIDLIHDGTELDDIATLIPERFGHCVRQLADASLNCLRESPAYDFERDKWLSELVR